jgi:hypothetical protein
MRLYQDVMESVTGGGLPPRYLKDFDPNVHAPMRPFPTGHATFTEKISDAMKFDSAHAVLDFWKTQSTKVPFRPDGEPNRPLTAFTIEAVEVKN